MQHGQDTAISLYHPEQITGSLPPEAVVTFVSCWVEGRNPSSASLTSVTRDRAGEAHRSLCCLAGPVLPIQALTLLLRLRKTTAEQMPGMTAATGTSLLDERIKSALSHCCKDPLSSAVFQHALKYKAMCSTLLVHGFPLNFQIAYLNPLDVSNEFSEQRVFMVKVFISGILIFKNSLLELVTI